MHGRAGSGPLKIWANARQHPGEVMAEYFLEGFIERLLDESDPVARSLRRAATFHCVPNMNPGVLPDRATPPYI
jgi:murein tripeptide amidase MpaA